MQPRYRGSPTSTSVPPAGAVVRQERIAKKREAIRKRIVEGVKRRAQQASKTTPEREGPDETREDGAAEGSEVIDRTGGELGAFVAVFNDDFMPLADECYEQALEVDPTLHGMLDVNIGIVADEDIGGLVQSVELGDENEVHSETMTECIRETMLSTLFPPVGDSGSTEIRLTLMFDPSEHEK